jgi:hypothetical protein
MRTYYYRMNRGSSTIADQLTLPRGSLGLCTDVPQLRVFDGTTPGGLVVHLPPDVYKVLVETHVKGKGSPFGISMPQKKTWLSRFRCKT